MSVLVLAGAVLLAPSAILACEIACAVSSAAGSTMEMDGATMPMPAGAHGCHDAAPRDNGPLAGAVHACTHIDGLATVFAERAVATALPPLTTFVLPLASAPFNGYTVWRPPARPPDRSPALTPLRI
jgi:hypothetical protein